jgi:hypothetical protein
MDTSLNLPATAAPVQTAPVLPRAITTKVQAIEAGDSAATLPSERPFVAQVVTAQLSGSEIPDNPSEIVPAERTLRPYDVPMLPSAEHSDLVAEPGPEINMTDAVELVS